MKTFQEQLREVQNRTNNGWIHTMYLETEVIQANKEWLTEFKEQNHFHLLELTAEEVIDELLKRLSVQVKNIKDGEK